MPKRQEIFFRQIVGACDVATLVVSYIASHWVRDNWLRSWYGALFPFAEYVWILWVIVPTWLLLLRSLRLYDSTSYESLGGIVRTLLKVQVLGGLTLLSTMYLTKSDEVSRLLLQTFLGVSFFGLVAQKVGVKVVLDRFHKRHSSHLRKVLSVGISVSLAITPTGE